jgi:hypothetical protein
MLLGALLGAVVAVVGVGVGVVAAGSVRVDTSAFRAGQLAVVVEGEVWARLPAVGLGVNQQVRDARQCDGE